MSLTKTRLMEKSQLEQKKTDSFPCVFRSKEFTDSDCATCGGHLRLKLFQCDKLKSPCTILRATSLYPICRNCQYRKEPENG